MTQPKTPDEMIALLPCPFCDAPLIAYETESGIKRHRHPYNGCVADDINFAEKSQKRIGWNTRVNHIAQHKAVVAENARLLNALEQINEIANRNGIQQWHEETKGVFMHEGGDQITHKAGYYVNATHILKCASISEKALRVSPRPASNAEGAG